MPIVLWRIFARHHGGGWWYVAHGGSPRFRRQGEWLHVRDRRNLSESTRVVAGQGPVRPAMAWLIVWRWALVFFDFRRQRRGQFVDWKANVCSPRCLARASGDSSTGILRFFFLRCRGRGGRAIAMQVTVAAACVRVRPRAGRVVAFVSGPVLRPRYLLYLQCSRFFFHGGGSC